MKKIDCPRAGVVFCIVAFAISAAAQNTFPATGNVGIGTTSPHNSLELSGGAVDFYNPGAWVAVGMDYDPSTDTFRFRSNNASDNLNQTNISIQRVSGNVGIGTSSPHSLLDLSSQTQGSDRIRLSGLEFNWGQTSTDGIAMRVGINRPGNRQLWVADSAAAINTTNAQLRFLVGSGAGYAAVDSVSTDGSTYTNLSLNPVGGNVGIGTTNPQKKLHIAGDVEIDGSLYFGSGSQPQSAPYAGINCGADYAESVDVIGDRAKYEPGDVLVIDSRVPGKFLKSKEAYSTTVAGIYSTKPGFVGRLHPATDPASANEIPMAMVGRVPTKVTAENGPIEVGDLLVTSSNMGYAMKGTDRSRMLGTVIGKALGSLDSGTGTIEVLVTLQ